MIKNPITLMSVEDFGSLVSVIEKELPGYWYSISQKKQTITISVGPSLYCLLDADRAWSLTREGDSGIVCAMSLESMNISKMSPKDFFNEQIISLIREARKNIQNTTTVFPEYQRGRRVHDSNARQRVRKKYTNLLRDLPDILTSDVDLEEVYIGSCHTSADCSLRGKYLNKKFDFSKDLFGEKDTMDQAIELALSELKKSFLTEKV